MQEAHIFTGMSRDKHPSAQDVQNLWDAHNIRITTRDGSSLLAITNEKSTKKILSFNSGEKYVGHMACGDYLVVFIHTSTEDIIYRIEFSTKDKKILYKGTNLNFDIRYPIQAIFNYETELIQKVYWVDAKNQPRVINIKKPELTNAVYDEVKGYSECYKDNPFDFVQELKLNEDVEVTRNDADNGIFSPGIIQYAFTYYFKYGQESNIFYVTEPLYIAHDTRGGAADKRINCSFTINIKGVDDNFEYIRVYSIARSSVDTTHTVKRVKDLKISDLAVSADSYTYLYTDTNTEGETVDPNQLLYLGGKDIIANCIHSKDSTLFLGNISYNRTTPYDKSKGTPLNDILSNNIAVTCGTRTVTLKEDNSIFYKYTNQLFTNTQTFKSRDHYRLGVQLQYKNGEWSEPIPIPNGNIWEHTMNASPDLEDNILKLPKFKGTLNTGTDISDIKNKGYVKIRPIIVPPNVRDRKILAQGILCPTVFNAQNRFNNSPYAQSSWLIRPFVSSSIKYDDAFTVKEGSVAAFHHMRPLFGQGRSCEVQNMKVVDRGDISDWSQVLSKLKDFDFSLGGMYYVDQSILTMHSPDIDSDNELNFIEGNQLKVQLAGIVEWNSNYGDIRIETSSTHINNDARGFCHVNTKCEAHGGKSLISGLFYEDSAVQYEKDKGFDKTDTIYSWMVYMWHNSGSLNNDINRPAGMGTRTSQLRKKIISNIKYSNSTKFDRTQIPLITTPVNIFNSNEVTQVKLQIKEDGSTNLKDISYFGNIDSMTGGNKENELEIGAEASVDYFPDGEYSTDGLSSGLYIQIPDNGYVNSNGDTNTDVFLTRCLYLQNVILTKVSSDKYNVEAFVSGKYEDVDIYLQDYPDIKMDLTTTKVSLEGIFSSVEEDGGFEDVTGETISMTLVLKPEKISLTGSMGDTVQTINNITGNSIYITIYIKKEDIKEDSYSKKFNSAIRTLTKKDVNDSSYPNLVHPTFPVRIKYKSLPHAVFAFLDANGNPKNIGEIPHPCVTQNTMSYSLLAEIYQNPINPFGNIHENMWIPAGKAVRIEEFESKGIEWIYGDTWYQRYDCLKTYPFTREDENQVIEIGSFMCESRINLDGRTDRNRGLMSNLDISPQNFNLRNKVYDQSNNFFNYRRLGEDFYKLNNFPSQVLWGNTKVPSDIVDSWTNLHLANSLELDGNYGSVTSINSFKDTLIGFQEHAINNILFNSRVQVETTDGVPIEIQNNNKVGGTRFISDTVGCSDKFSVVTGSGGLYFVDYKTMGLYRISDTLENLGLVTGMNSWLQDVKCGLNWMFEYRGGIPHPVLHNGIRLFYDPINYDVYFIPGKEIYNGITLDRKALGYSEQTQSFISTYDYGGSVMMFSNSKIYSLAEDVKTGNLALWENFSDEGYGKIFNKDRSYMISFISNNHPMDTKIFDGVEFKGDLFNNNEPLPVNDKTYMEREEENRYDNSPFDTIQVTNEYQDTYIVPFNKSSLRRKFRYWRGLIPRQHNSRARIRSPWCRITLTKNPTNKKATIYGIAVNYTT